MVFANEMYGVFLVGLFIQLTKQCHNPAEAWLAVTTRFHSEPYPNLCKRLGINISKEKER